MRFSHRQRTSFQTEDEYDQNVEQEYDERKFRELVVLVASRLVDDEAGGATKLNKVLYFADFAHVRRTGRSITGAAYQKLTNGPAPRRLIPVRKELLRDGAATLEERDFLGYKQNRLVPTRPADESVFDADEMRTIHDVLADLDGMNAREVSDLSHEEAGWRLTEEGDTISYASAFIPREQPLTPAAADQAAAVAERYGIATSA